MEKANCKKAHVLAVPFPAQGHIKPLMKLCRQIAKHGIKVSFANVKSIHDKMVAAAAGDDDDEGNFKLVAIPDRPEDSPNDVLTVGATLRATLPQSLTDLVERNNISDSKITCVIADVTISWILETTNKLGVENFLFSPFPGAAFALTYHIPKLLEEGLLDPNGNIKEGEKLTLTNDIPPWGNHDLPWRFPNDIVAEKVFFGLFKTFRQRTKQVAWLLSNTIYDLESSACDFIPNLLPIGPLLETDAVKSSYNFHVEDASCLSWLDSKPPRSVIYVSFGSLAVFSRLQLHELATGLELSGRCFLWVVRPDLGKAKRAAAYPDGFLERVSEVGKIVEWAPQEKVLSHPSLACFLSHCGWNSILECLSKGVPFLCWPYFGDQLHNQNLICDKWEIGLRIEPDQNGIRSSHEIKTKIDLLFSDDNLKENALKLKEMSTKSLLEGGNSYKNFNKFIDHLKN